MDVLGLVLVLIFYAVILLTGVWIAQRSGVLHPASAQDLMLAKKHFGLTVGIFTLVSDSALTNKTCLNTIALL